MPFSISFHEVATGLPGNTFWVPGAKQIALSVSVLNNWGLLNWRHILEACSQVDYPFSVLDARVCSWWSFWTQGPKKILFFVSVLDDRGWLVKLSMCLAPRYFPFCFCTWIHLPETTFWVPRTMQITLSVFFSMWVSTYLVTISEHLMPSRFLFLSLVLMAGVKLPGKAFLVHKSSRFLFLCPSDQVPLSREVFRTSIAKKIYHFISFFESKICLHENTFWVPNTKQIPFLIYCECVLTWWRFLGFWDITHSPLYLCSWC